MKLFVVLRKECVCHGLKLSDIRSALEEIARVAKASMVLKDVPEEDIVQALEEREQLGSTGFKGGVAIPHCRLEAVTNFVVGILSIPDGVEFDALDGKKVRLMVFIIGPAKESDDHIHLLCGISNALSVPGAVEEMVSAPSNDALMENFLRLMKDEVSMPADVGHNLFHVFVQDENLFREILQVFGGIESTFAMVLDAENISTYLFKMPLFAGIWRDDPRSFSRLILALVNKGMTNETIRRIERVTGPLTHCNGIFVMVQDIFYCSGKLTS